MYDTHHWPGIIHSTAILLAQTAGLRVLVLGYCQDGLTHSFRAMGHHGMWACTTWETWNPVRARQLLATSPAGPCHGRAHADRATTVSTCRTACCDPSGLPGTQPPPSPPCFRVERRFDATARTFNARPIRIFSGMSGRWFTRSPAVRLAQRALAGCVEHMGDSTTAVPSHHALG